MSPMASFVNFDETYRYRQVEIKEFVSGSSKTSKLLTNTTLTGWKYDSRNFSATRSNGFSFSSTIMSGVCAILF